MEVEVSEGRACPKTVSRIRTTLSRKVFFEGGRLRCSGLFFFHLESFLLIARGLIRLRRGSIRSSWISQSSPRYQASNVTGVLASRVPDLPRRAVRPRAGASGPTVLDQANSDEIGLPLLIRNGRPTASLTSVDGSIPRAWRMVAPRSSGPTGSRAG
jgi:hypothetical protein